MNPADDRRYWSLRTQLDDVDDEPEGTPRRSRRSRRRVAGAPALKVRPRPRIPTLSLEHSPLFTSWPSPSW